MSDYGTIIMRWFQDMNNILAATQHEQSTGHICFQDSYEIYVSLGTVYQAPISSPVEQNGPAGYRLKGAESIDTWTNWRIRNKESSK